MASHRKEIPFCVHFSYNWFFFFVFLFSIFDVLWTMLSNFSFNYQVLFKIQAVIFCYSCTHWFIDDIAYTSHIWLKEPFRLMVTMDKQYQVILLFQLAISGHTVFPGSNIRSHCFCKYVYMQLANLFIAVSNLTYAIELAIALLIGEFSERIS